MGSPFDQPPLLTAIPTITISIIFAGLVSIAIAITLSQHILQNSRARRIPSAIWNRLRPTATTSKATTADDGDQSGAMTRLLGFPNMAPQGIMASVAEGLKKSLPVLTPRAKASRTPAGLGNINNSCFQNSVLQGLSALESMPEYLNAAGAFEEEQGLGKTSSSSSSSSSTAVALRDFVDALRSLDNNGKVLWTPARLKSMDTWQQQDAQEYFTKLLDEVEREMAKAAQAPPRGLELGLGGAPSSLSSSSSSMHSVDSGYHSTSLADATEASARARAFKSPLEGLLAQRVVCTRCKHTDGLDLIPFNFLTINLPLNREMCSLKECFDAYTQVEEIEGVECAKCTLVKAHGLLTRLVERHANSPTPPIAIDDVLSRLQSIEQALADEDFDWKTVQDKCHIAPRNRVTSTKTKQTVIARPPQSLVLHINRSVFDERTGNMYKNTAAVGYEPVFDLGKWCIGSVSACPPTEDADFDPHDARSQALDMEEQWNIDPYSALNNATDTKKVMTPLYGLRAVITHSGRHDNGHYVCYKQVCKSDTRDDDSQDDYDDDYYDSEEEGEELELGPRYTWWRLSDETVTPVVEVDMMRRVEPGAFMLFYECAVPANDGLMALAMRDAAVRKMEKLHPLTPPRDHDGLESASSSSLSDPPDKSEDEEPECPMTPASLAVITEDDEAEGDQASMLDTKAPR